MDKNNLIAHLYADYVSWCKSNCIAHETFATFYNQVQHYSMETLERGVVEYEWLRLMEEAEGTGTPFLDRLKLPKGTRGYWGINGPTHYMTPIQPNDEQRAVAEVMRMLGGEG